MRAHAKLHGIGRPFGCESCGKTFQRKQDLKRHEFTHEGMKLMCVDVGWLFRGVMRCRGIKRVRG
ncbi:hypothetical protein BC829DRAFT_368432, partial [Chytridium lagenaria]